MSAVPLEEYRRKRDFTRTAEPAGTPGGGAGATPDALAYVVHKHAARSLHYDLRLELDGVLLSWAVPKGPSLDPADKRLAMRVEDHPLEYGAFEGTIPPGEYGAGTVIVWDRGVWAPLAEGAGSARAGLEAGALKFTLTGEKLTGAWALVRMKPRPGERGESWLLIKERDGHAQPRGAYDVLAARPESVASGRTVEQVAAGASAGAPRSAAAPDGASGVRSAPAAPGARATVPADAPVQLATLSAAPPEGTQWLHEVKYDGYRLRIAREGGAVRVLTRGGQEWGARFPALVSAALELPAESALLDGEVVVFGDRGVPDFGALQDALADGGTGEVAYIAFDLLHLDGRDLRDMPLLERKHLLRELLADGGASAPIRYADHVEGRGGEFLAAACGLGLEGAVSKRAGAPYRPGRSSEWRKTRCARRQEFVVAGATAPAGSRTGFGALLLGYYDEEGVLRYAGRVGTGFAERHLEDISARLEKIAVKAAPLDPAPRIPGRPVRWVRPEIVVEVGFAEWPTGGLVRHSRFLGMREDRDPRSVHRDDPHDADTAAAAAPAFAGRLAPPPGDMARSLTAVRLTNPDKPLFPAEDAPGGHAPVTKADLAAYYRLVAAVMLPHLAGRPLSLVRCPHGRRGECFFQKHPDQRGFSPHLPLVDITERNGDTAAYFYLTGVEGLIALVQLGVLEVHAWNSLIPATDTPDRIVFDLDPGPGVSPDAVREGAFIVSDALAGRGLTGFVRTTGGAGLHVVAPIVPDPAHGYDAARRFAHALVDDLATRMPDRFTARMAKAARPGRIFLDYLRNAHGATAIASYSTRARPGAPVAVPLSWEELAESFEPASFDVTTVPARVAALAEADPWSGYDEARAPLPSG